jgi:hypothetical protein
MPIIDMHFHTTWVAPERKEPLTGFISPKTPDELRRLNIAAVNRYHIVKVVASGDQLASYEQELVQGFFPESSYQRKRIRQPHFDSGTRKESSPSWRNSLLNTEV